MMKQGKGQLYLRHRLRALWFSLPFSHSASKWAIHGLMKTVAMEAGSFGIRANASRARLR